MITSVILKELDEIGLTNFTTAAVSRSTPPQLLPLFVNSLNMTFSANLFNEVLETDLTFDDGANVIFTIRPTLISDSDLTLTIEDVQYNRELKRIEFKPKAINAEDYILRDPPLGGSRLDLTVAIEKNGVKKPKSITLIQHKRSIQTFTGMTGEILPSERSLWQVLSRLKQAGKNNNRFETSETLQGYGRSGYGGSTPATMAGNYDTNSWAYSLDTTGIPVGSNLFKSAYTQANMGCLIAPRIGIGVAHWSGNFRGGSVNTLNTLGVPDNNHTVGNTVVFKDKNNITYTKTIVASINYDYLTHSPTVSSTSNVVTNLDGSGISHLDLVIYLLDSELPSSISPVQLLGENFLNANKLFFGAGIRVNQFNQIIPALGFNTSFPSDQFIKDGSAEYSTKLITYKGIRSFDTEGYFVPPEKLDMIDIWSLEYYTEVVNGNIEYRNTEVISLPNNFYNSQKRFFGSLFNEADVYPQAGRLVTVGDSGTPVLYVGDGGKLAINNIISGTCPFSEVNYPWIVAQIDALRSRVSDTGAFTYPQIMTPPTDDSVVDR